MMTKRLVAGASLALALLVGGAGAADALKSGPQVGKAVEAFEPRNVTGPFAPENHCLVCWTASKPGVMILARRTSDPLTGLIKKIDAANKEQGDKLRSFVVFLDDEKGLDEKLKELAAKEKLEKTVLAIDNPKDSVSDTVHKEAEVTVILFVKHEVKVNRAYRKGEFKAEEVEKVLKELPKVLGDETK
ncbi:MAG TPA: hypothetical protein VKA46_14790 [Gemmataceae bacterium]|nr:hypothetical protein [Gemmataceae bacterium]